MSNKQGKYINRDISWLSFNGRVLDEARDSSLPLYERLKFLAIYSSNLDEFYKVRVSSYKRALAKAEKGSPERAEINRVRKEILRIVDGQQEEFGKIFREEIIPGLERNGIVLYRDQKLHRSARDYISQYHSTEVLPYLQPLLLVRGKILPFLQNDTVYIAARLLGKEHAGFSGSGKKKARYVLVNVPSSFVPRFIQLPAGTDDGHLIIFLDDVIRMNLDVLFPGYDVESSYSVKLSRDADLGIEDEFSVDLPQIISESLVKRKTGAPSRFLYDREMPESFLKFLRQSLKIPGKDLVPGGEYHNLSDLFSFPNPVSPKLEAKALKSFHRPELAGNESLLTAMEQKDRVLHFPYHTYDPVIRFLNEAAMDPDVKAIKVTQYRVAPDSAIVSSLINASNNGKKVTVFVEIKARFDERSNLEFSKLMKKAGIRILFSIPGLKVHAKMALVMKKSGASGAKAFAFLSTGNFNEKTARIYADHGLFTCDKNITSELRKLFTYLEKRKARPEFSHLLVARFNLKKKLSQLIHREIREAEAGKEARILLKMNGLDNKEIIDLLYEASRKGVRIDIIVRGICCLVPGEKFSRNITVTRIVDRYLEHARVFVFHNGGDETMYLSSADLMNRNLNRRIELVFPVYDHEVRKEIMKILRLQLADNTKARVLDNHHNNLGKKRQGAKSVRAQVDTYTYLKDLARRVGHR
jgi:polyphosphate kinase